MKQFGNTSLKLYKMCVVTVGLAWQTSNVKSERPQESAAHGFAVLCAAEMTSSGQNGDNIKYK